MWVALAVFSLVVGLSAGLSFIPAADIMSYGADGELIAIWGEHGFYQDTSSFGGFITYANGTIGIGSSYVR